MTQIDQLPDDPKVLKRWIVEREIEREQEFQSLIARIKDEAARQLDVQRERMEAERRAANRHAHGRGELPEHLPRIAIEHQLSEAEKPCPCCGELRLRIGQEVSEQLEYMPASLQVLQHIRGKYACPKCEQEGYNPNIVAAPLPPQPIEKGLPGPGLLAYVVVSKLGDHLPLYRLEKIFARQQVHLARSTMCAWMQGAGELTRPLVARMKQRVKKSRTIHTDDTTVPIQAPGQKKCRQGRIWTYLGDADHPYTVYEYTPNRTRAGPANWLAGWKGFLQADAYGGYDGIYAHGGVTEADQDLARRGSPSRLAEKRDGQGDRLCAQSMGRVVRLHHARFPEYRQ